MTSYADLAGSAPGKITKSRGRSVVKPIFKRQPHSHSAKSSLDLDRGWEEQIHYGTHGWGGSVGAGKGSKGSTTGWGVTEGAREGRSRTPAGLASTGYSLNGTANGGTGAGGGVGGLGGSGLPATATASAAGTGGGAGSLYDFDASRSIRDVGFNTSATDLHGANRRANFSHARSFSGTSHTSIGTTGSGHGPAGYARGNGTGTFMHPFQQTPRASTPPLSYANSLASFEPSNSRDYSPTITEDDDDLPDHPSATGYPHHPHHHHRTGSLTLPHRGSSSSGNNPVASTTGINLSSLSSATLTNSNGHHHHAANGSYSSTSNLRRPSLASQRTSSFSELSGPPQLRINTTSTARSHSSGPGSRLAHVSSTSDLHKLANGSKPPSLTELSPSTATAPARAFASPLSLVSPSSSINAMSPIRSSLEHAGFRLRSRSDLDSSYHADRIREERRKWEEKERAKEAKRDKDDMKRRDKADTKEAHRFEREQAQLLRDAAAAAKKEAKKRDAAARKGSSAGIASGPGSATPSGRNSLSLEAVTAVGSGSGGSLIRPSHSRNRSLTSGLDDEKLVFASRNYESTDPGLTPRAGDVTFATQKRTVTAKRKTQGAWTSFVLWFRTRVLRLTQKP